MITRDEALEVLYDLINSGIIAEDLEEALEDIAKCIRAEDKERDLGIDIWGAEENDWIDLYILKREDLITPEWTQHCEEVYEKYRIKGEHDHPPLEKKRKTVYVLKKD